MGEPSVQEDETVTGAQATRGRNESGGRGARGVQAASPDGRIGDAGNTGHGGGPLRVRRFACGERDERMNTGTLEVVDTDHATSLAVRREVVTGPNSHVDVVTVPPGGEIGVETHADADETLLVVSGTGEADLDGERTPVRVGSVVFIPRGIRHNVRNRGPVALRLYAVHAASA